MRYGLERMVLYIRVGPGTFVLYHQTVYRCHFILKSFAKRERTVHRVKNVEMVNVKRTILYRAAERIHRIFPHRHVQVRTVMRMGTARDRTARSVLGKIAEKTVPVSDRIVKAVRGPIVGKTENVSVKTV